jgi:alpha-glucosidase (family GH31 glycosyl hydrolase)
VVLQTSALRVEVTLRPFAFVIRRAGFSLLRAGGAWAVDGEIRDQFLQFTEGVLACEERTPVERLVGLGLRHHPRLDHAGRDIQLGADRHYTGPDCPAEMLSEGGIPQGDCAPVPWLLSSRGYGVWCAGDGNGTCFDLAGERISVSTRALAGALSLEVVGGRTPAARLRELCRLTGFPAQLPERGYGFWKSRDVHEHQDDVLDDSLGFRRHRIPLDAIVIDSPWATQYNTWEFNPHQFPDAAYMISSMRAAGVRTLWGVPRLGRTAARLADGGCIGWRDGRWELPPDREIKVFERSL